MNAGRSGRQRNIQPVVDEHRHFERGDEIPGAREQLAGRGVFEPKLDTGHAPAYRRLADGDEVAAAQQGVVRDEHQPK